MIISSAPRSSLFILVIHGLLAFLLNIANFNAVKESGVLVMNVVGNMKQVAMIFISLFIFGNKIKPVGILGSVICILGSLWYTYGKEWNVLYDCRKHPKQKGNWNEDCRRDWEGFVDQKGTYLIVYICLFVCLIDLQNKKSNRNL